MRRFNLLLFFVVLSAGLFAQTDTSYKPLFAKTPLYGSYGFAHTVYGRLLPISGLQASVGVNVAGLFHKNWLIGPTLEWRVFKALGLNTRYYNLRKAINDNLIYSQGNLTDSTRVQFLHSAFNDLPGGYSFYNSRFFGSNHYRYGIIISPFPDDYGGFMLGVKRGMNVMPVDGAYGITALEYETEYYIFLSVPVDLSVELTCKPFMFLHERSVGQWYDFISQHVLLSFYWDRISMHRAEFNGAPLNDFLAPAFFEENGTDNQFGFKLAIGYY